MMRAMKRRPAAMLVLCTIVALTIGAACLRGAPDAAWPNLQPADSQAAEEPLAPGPAPGLLDGIVLSPEDAAQINTRLPVAVMIDNLVGVSRPQIGLDRADLVYEFLVEGGITRFMAVYLHNDVDVIEPVRSARTPSVILARELDAVLVHVGAAETEGTANAGRQMLEWGVKAIDGDHDKAPFQRDYSRRAPHNMVTSTRAIRERAAEHGWSGPPTLTPWLFRDGGSSAEGEGQAVSEISYGFAARIPAQPAYSAAWSYDAGTNRYLRSMAGAAHVDGRSRARLAFDNVVVELHRASVVDREGHIVYEQVGEGVAWIFRDGRGTEARWQKGSTDERTRYWSPDGEELSLNRGTTWVALVPAGSPFRYR